MSIGYAVRLNGEILIETVSPTERGAKVNFLHTRISRIYNNTTDEQINEMFDNVALKYSVSFIKVAITELN